ncbi:MAG: nucleotidyltransferase family protein, partial [Bacteroidia bacterium]|nr:nucleotidyltransferase family protein [Bacteroidia bacterium]
AIILAAGESKRMRFPKMLLPFRGTTILEQVIENVINSQVDETVVVLGAESDEIQKVTGNWPVKHCYNADYKEGMLSSVKCGFRFLPHYFEAALVFQGDQPMIKPEITDMVIAAYRRSGKGIVMPVFENKRGHPLLLSSRYLEEISSLSPETGLREIASRHSDDVYEVNTGTAEILKDIDTEEDYMNELKHIK